MADLAEILKYWAADREAISSLGISNVEFDFDSGWEGTDVTPGDPPEIVVKYTYTRTVVVRKKVSELGEFITELAQVARRTAK